MKHFDNSQVGNDCMIYEHWYWVTQPEPCAIRLTSVSGWSDQPLDSFVFTKPTDEMPKEVVAWFATAQQT